MTQQAGGLGGARRGPGETQMEVDRRRIMRRINKLEADLRELQRTRQQQRRGRPAPAWPTFPSSGTRTPASRPCSIGSPRRGCSSRTACSPPRPDDAAPRASRAASRCSPTPLVSSAACPTASWRRSSPRSNRSPRLICSSILSTPPVPTHRDRSTPCCRARRARGGPRARAARLQQDRRRARDGAARGRSPRGQRRDLRRERRRLRPVARRDRRSPASPQRIVELLVPFERGDVVAAIHREGEVVSTSNEEGDPHPRADVRGQRGKAC